MINVRKFFKEKKAGNLSDGACNIFHIAMNNSKNANGQYCYFLTDSVDISSTHTINDPEIAELVKHNVITSSSKIWLYDSNGNKIGVKITFS